MKKTIVAFLFFLLMISPVLAQAQVDLISEKKSIIEEIAEVDRTYKGQLAEYRQAADQFNIAKGQFTKLNTLASLEVAVQDGRKALLLRDRVLLTYLKLIELKLLESDGINLEEKTIALDMTKDLQQDFQAHLDLTNNAIDRVAVNQVADDFEILAPKITNLSNYVSTLLRIGKLQTIYDHSLSLVEKTNPNAAGAEPSLKQNEMIRAHTEVVNLMEKIYTNLRYGWDEIRVAREKEKPIDLSKSNASVFADLSQTMLFLAEIVSKR